jgi:integrase
MPTQIETTHTLMERTLVVYRRERSSIWQCRYKVDGVWQRVSTKEVDLKKAKERAKEIFIAAEIRKKENIHVVTRKFRHCAILAIDRMNQEKKVNAGKVIYDTYIRVLNDYVIPVLGNKNIAKITVSDIDDLYKKTQVKMKRVPTRSTMLKHVSAINRVFEEAIARGFVTKAQLPELTSKGKESKVGPSFTLNEIRALRGNFESWINRARSAESKAKRELLRDYVDILLDTGARPGKELLDLTWNKIEYIIDPKITKTGAMYQDLESGETEEISTVNINRSVALTVSGKTGQRTIVGMGRSCDALARIAKRIHNVSGNIARPFNSLLKPNNKKHVFVWKTVDKNGKETIHRGKGFEHMFVAYLREHGLLVDPKTEQNRKLYSLRHTYATFVLEIDKVRIHTLAKQMGTSVQMIEKHYSHLQPRRVIDQLRGHESRRLIDTVTEIDEIYASNKTKIKA